MDKEKEESLTKMASIINLNRASSFQIAVALDKAGYGNVKQAVKEFAEKLKETIHNDDFEQLCQDGAASEDSVFWYIDQLLEG